MSQFEFNQVYVSGRYQPYFKVIEYSWQLPISATDIHPQQWLALFFSSFDIWTNHHLHPNDLNVWRYMSKAMDVDNSDAGCSVDISRTLASDFGLVPPAAPIHQNVSLHQASLASCSQEFPPVFPPHLDSAGGVLDSSSNSSHVNATFGSTNLTGLFLPPLLNATGANTSATPIPADPFGSLLEESMLDEISLLDLAMEEGFSHAQASQLRDELDSDSGLSLDSSRSPASPSSSETSSSSSSSTSATFSEEGAVGYSTAASDSEEGAVGGYQPEYSKLCRMSFQVAF